MMYKKYIAKYRLFKKLYISKKYNLLDKYYFEDLFSYNDFINLRYFWDTSIVTRYFSISNLKLIELCINKLWAEYNNLEEKEEDLGYKNSWTIIKILRNDGSIDSGQISNSIDLLNNNTILPKDLVNDIIPFFISDTQAELFILYNIPDIIYKLIIPEIITIFEKLIYRELRYNECQYIRDTFNTCYNLYRNGLSVTGSYKEMMIKKEGIEEIVVRFIEGFIENLLSKQMFMNKLLINIRYEILYKYFVITYIKYAWKHYSK